MSGRHAIINNQSWKYSTDKSIANTILQCSTSAACRCKVIAECNQSGVSIRSRSHGITTKVRISLTSNNTYDEATRYWRVFVLHKLQIRPQHCYESNCKAVTSICYLQLVMCLGKLPVLNGMFESLSLTCSLTYSLCS